MRRRDVIVGIGSATAAAALASHAAQAQSAMPVVGFLSTESPDTWASRVRAFKQGLEESGFVEGKNVAIEYRWAEHNNKRLPELAADLVRRRVSVIAVNGAGVPVVKTATSTIPIVFQFGGDPVAIGFAKTLSRPGGNLTGVTSLTGEVGPKKVELLHELLPPMKVVGVLVNASNPNNAASTRAVQTAAHQLGLELQVLHASTEDDLETAFARLAQAKAEGLVVNTDGFLNTQSERLAELSVRHAVPAIFQYREFTAAGGLMAYGGSLTDPSYKVGLYTGRILKGEKPADLPVQQATKVELFINLKTAKALGITVPLPLLGRADEVIE